MLTIPRSLCSETVIFRVLIVLLYITEMETYLISSYCSLKQLMKTQRNVIDSIKSRVPEINGEKSNLVNECTREHTKATPNIGRYLENPINAYTLIKRLSRDLNEIETISKENKISNKGYKRDPTLLYPSNKDLVAITRALTHLIRVYRLNVSDLAHGVLSGRFRTTLSASDCYQLALEAENVNEYDIASSWSMEASQKCHQEGHLCPHTEEELDKFITAAKRMAYKESRKKMIPPNKLCLEENVKDDTLSCYYKYGPHPLLRLARMKVEPLHTDPDVTLFHDVISDYEINEIQQLTKMKIEAYNRYHFNDVDSRLTKVPILEDKTSSVVAKISRRVLDMSGSSSFLADKTSTVSYGVAGFYIPHLDVVILASANNLPKGYRKSTVLFYLTDVNLGGATAFPLLNLSLFPRKNGALLWNNLLPNGRVDERTLHEACPVLHGNKWITTKWLSEPTLLDSCHKDDSSYWRHPEKIRGRHLSDLSPLSYETVNEALQNLKINV